MRLYGGSEIYPVDQNYEEDEHHKHKDGHSGTGHGTVSGHQQHPQHGQGYGAGSGQMGGTLNATVQPPMIETEAVREQRKQNMEGMKCCIASGVILPICGGVIFVAFGIAMLVVFLVVVPNERKA